MTYLIEALQRFYRHDQNVYVSGNLLLYYIEGDRKAAVAPDVFVVQGVEKRSRRCFLLWKEGRSPSLVIEVTSESTRDEDQGKKSLYQSLGIEEYFLHDLLSEYLNPPLQGFRLQGGCYRRIAPERDGTLVSRTTGLGLRRQGDRLHLIDLDTGESLRSLQDYQEEEARLAEALRTAEEELARLRREIDSRR
jgi:Uma2 family endonuclease